MSAVTAEFLEEYRERERLSGIGPAIDHIIRDYQEMIKKQWDLNYVSRSVSKQIEQELTQKIQLMTGSYISANQMLQLLEQLLVKMPQVQLAALENLPAKPVLLGADEKAKPLLYQHRTKLIFHGNYASLQKLLAQLQQLSWQLHWVKLNYKVVKYPEAQLELELATVSESATYVQI